MTKQDSPPDRPLLAYMGLGFEVSGILLGSALLGHYLDKWLATSPIFILVMVLLGTAAVLLRVVLITKWIERRDR